MNDVTDGTPNALTPALLDTIRVAHERAIRIASLEEDVRVLIEMNHAALDVLRDVTTDRDRLRQRYHTLLEQTRRDRQLRQAA